MSAEGGEIWIETNELRAYIPASPENYLFHATVWKMINRLSFPILSVQYPKRSDPD